jgi:hypothetical protein
MAGRHQTHAMNLRQFSLRIDGVARFQLPGLEPFQNRTLNSLVRGQPIWPDLSHEHSLGT